MWEIKISWWLWDYACLIFCERVRDNLERLVPCWLTVRVHTQGVLTRLFDFPVTHETTAPTMVQKSFDKKPIFFHQSAVLTWKMPPSASPHHVETQDIPTSPENNSITNPDMVARSVKSNDETAKPASLGSYAVGFWFIDGPGFVSHYSHLI